MLLFGFGGLLFLLFTLGISATLFLRRAEMENERMRQQDLSRNRSLERFRTAIYLSGTHVRDYLLDQKNPPSMVHASRFEQESSAVAESLTEFSSQLQGQDPTVLHARKEMENYLRLLSGVFEWPASERTARRYSFTDDELLPRRMKMLGQADQLQTVSERQSEANSRSIGVLLSTYRTELGALLALTVTAGLLLAGITLIRLLRLERESQARLEAAVRAREEMERLSSELLTAQETERRKISRDLHDEVGQNLYAAMLTLGNLRSSVASGEQATSIAQLDKLSEITSHTAAGVRDLALLLRPSMLDDLGLIPALKWFAKEVTRTRPVPVELIADEFVEDLSDDLRTCIYRVVQEGVHNAERHSHANHIVVELRQNAEGLDVRIADDGRGFDPASEAGLGLLGMQERVTRLGGSIKIDSAPAKGTRLQFHLPSAQTIRPLRTA